MRMVAEILKKIVAEAAGIGAAEVQLEHPADLSHGDYATNVALKIFGPIAHGNLKKAVGRKGSRKTYRFRPHIHGTFRNAREFADHLVQYIEQNKPDEVERAEVAGPGFINFYLSRDFFAQSVSEILLRGDRWGSSDTLKGKKVMVEYTDPNPFKEFHIGHLMSNAIGEAISRVVEFSGAEVHRANYQGDVGVHVAKAIWGKKQKPELSWGEAYAHGAMHYEKYKEEIDVINKKLYERLSAPEESDKELNKLYDEGREESLREFESVYKVLGTRFDHYFFESEAVPIGAKLVREHAQVFEESEGAVVFRGEKHDPKLHTRVFITSQGIPTYEAKELGLAKMKFDVWPHDRSVVITAHEIEMYYRVVMKALEQIEPELAEKIQHVPHGFLRLPTGKMSSRTGDVVAAMPLAGEVQRVAMEKMKESGVEQEEAIAREVAVAALKYSILKQSVGRDVVFDMRKALSFEGDSGPYLQYTHARTVSLTEKAAHESVPTHLEVKLPNAWEVAEVERFLYRFPEVVEHAVVELKPHYVTVYLTDLAGAFNSWYAKEKILDGTEAATYKLALARAVGTTLKNGLWLLGIRAPERM